MGLDFNARRDVLMAFATPLAQTRVREAAEINPGLRRAILDREAAAPGQSRSNVGGWHSKGDLLTWGGKEIAVLEESFREAAGRMMALIAHPQRCELDQELVAWAESRIKALTGGDPISARFMRQDFFTFTPTFKLVICGNHRPSLRNVDEAIRRRLFLIPFDVFIPPDERDDTLPERLRAEWAGILEWAIDGCLDWLEHGLAAPERVRAATDEYLTTEDSFATWIEEAVDRSDGAHETTADLYQSWKAWADRAGEFVGSQKRFSQTLRDRGFEPKRQAGTGRAGFDGVRLIRPDYTDREGW